MAAMDIAVFRRLGPAAAVGAALVVVGPAIAFGFGGTHGGGARHGGFHAAAHPAAPPAIDAPAARPPFVGAPPAMRMRVGFRQRDDGFRFRDRFGRDRFRDRRFWGLGGPWGWGGYWGGGAAYEPSAGEPVYVQPSEPRAEAPPPCPELITWQPRLGRATRQRLCDDVPDMRG
jgi:hypothetical protein